MSLTVVAALTSAFATKPEFDCSNFTQYYWNGSGYVLAGEYGTNYDCNYTDLSTCTYYHPLNQPTVFAACRPGDFILIMAARKQ